MHPLDAFLNRVVSRVSPTVYVRIGWHRDKELLANQLVDLCVRRGDTAADVGAHFGYYTDRLARLVGDEGHVHAFEPNPAMWPRLKFLARRRNVTVHRFALSDRNGTGTLHIPSVAGSPVDAMATLDPQRRAFRNVYRSVPVELRRLDDVLPRKGRRLSFVKCDVDGHELHVLRGAEETLKRDRPLLLVEIEQRVQEEGRDVSQTFQYLEELGYVGYFLRERELAPLADFDVERDQLALLDESMVDLLPGYVNEFLFVPPNHADLVAPLLERVSRARIGGNGSRNDLRDVSRRARRMHTALFLAGAALL